MEITLKESQITFETAKLAKEKGLNLDFWSTPSITSYYKPDGEKMKLEEFNKGFIKFCFMFTSQSLLQKWLREVHNIDIQLLGLKGTYYVGINKGNIGASNYFYPDRNSFENTLEVGLQEALKLI